MKNLIAPSTNFAAVRDGRNSQVFYVDVALDTARSAAAGTGLVLPISGNSFYIDANPADGNAFVHFQDTNFDRGPVPLYVSPGAIFNIPYTQVLIENSAQPGKKIRIAYGVDVDFQPGSVATLSVVTSGGNAPTRDWESPRAFYQPYNNTLTGANQRNCFYNPTASGKLMYVDSIDFQTMNTTTPGSNTIFQLELNKSVGGVGANNIIKMPKDGVSTSVITARNNGTGYTVPGAQTIIGNAILQGTVGYSWKFDVPIIVGNDCCLTLYFAGGLNNYFNYLIQWREF